MKEFIQSIRVYIVFTFIIGILYTGTITIISNLVFPSQANGSLIKENNIIKGSLLIGQQFTDTRYFYSRPSSISYNPVPSGASNLSVISSQLKDSVHMRQMNFISVNMLAETTHVPIEMLFSSGSGLDPDISQQSALLQINRIALQRHFTPQQKLKLASLVKHTTKRPQIGFLGENRVNVLKLNMSLDSMGVFR